VDAWIPFGLSHLLGLVSLRAADAEAGETLHEQTFDAYLPRRVDDPSRHLRRHIRWISGAIE
jgi:hypothetical protein